MTTYQNILFIKSAAEADQFVVDSGREIAFAGRSNAGKSSAINAITARAALARVSRTPGRTQLINFFELAPDRRHRGPAGLWVSPRSRNRCAAAGWRSDAALLQRAASPSFGLVLIVDSRRGLGAARRRACSSGCWPAAAQAHVLLTKSDKLNHTEGAQGAEARPAPPAADAAVTTPAVFGARAKVKASRMHGCAR
jgi:GTP-binding protein